MSALVQETAGNAKTRLIDLALGDGYLFGVIPRNECCAAANQIRPFRECDGLLGFATLQKALNATFHPDKLWQIGPRRLRMQLDSPRSTRTVFTGNLKFRPVALRSDRSEDRLA